MIKAFFAILAATTLYASAQDDPSLIFRASFDKMTVIADKAAGWNGTRNFKPETLHLRMHEGPAGKGNALCLGNHENVVYSNYKNHNPRQGTVSLWVNPKNWTPDKKKYQIFFESVFPGDYRFLLYKFADPASLRFLILNHGKEAGHINVPLSATDWPAGRWHKIDAVWDGAMMALYLDGALAKQQPYTPNPLKFSLKPDFPESTEKGWMQLGIDKAFGHDQNDATALDELEIYDRVLAPTEIKAGFDKFYPPVAKKESRPLLAVPVGKTISADGILSSGEWDDAACIPVINPIAGKKMFPPFARVFIKQDADNLMLSAELPGCRKATVTQDDLKDICNDDVFEFHIFMKDKQRRQFIINAKGALMDARMTRPDGIFDHTMLDTAWNSGARRGVSRHKDGWIAELIIPKKSLGADAATELAANFCVTVNGDRISLACWGLGCENYGDEKHFGTLLLKPGAPPVRLERFGDADGMFTLALTPAIKAVLTDARGTEFKRPVDAPEWKLMLPVGNYDFSAVGKDFNYSTRFAEELPLEVNYTCLASQRRVDLVVDLSKANAETRRLLSAGKLSAVAQMKDSAGKVLFEKAFVPRELKTVIAVPLPDRLPRGAYSFAAEVKGGGGALTAAKRFRVPDMTPYQLKVGTGHSVPSPWAPVRETGEKNFQVWNRVYVFGDGPFPVQVTCGGEKMLCSAPELLNGGERVQWTGFKIVERYDDFIKFAGAGSAAGLVFKWESELWFDGLVKTNIGMLPATGKTEIRNLTLQWSVPAQFARAMLDPLYSGWNGRDGEKYVFPYSHGADFIIWTVGLEKGFLWWPRSDANWVNSNGYKQFSLSRRNDVVTVRADFITQRAVLEKEALYTMAFLATPNRPEPSRRRDFNAAQDWGFSKYESAKMEGFVNPPDPHDWACEPWTGLVPYNSKRFQANIDKIEEHGSHFMPYSMPAHTAPIEESYDYFFPEWRQTPGTGVGGATEYKTGMRYEPEACCPHTGAGDLFVWRADKILTDYPKIAGLYYDICEGRLCRNTLHGCGGTDAFGKEFFSSHLLSLRDYFIRIKRVLEKHGKDKVLFLHAHNRFVPFAHGIGDYWFPGEQYAHAFLTNLDHFYCENIPLREYQSAYYTPIRGSGLEFFGLYWFTADRIPGAKRLHDYPHTVQVMTPCLLHDMNVSNAMLHHPTVERWWIIKHDIDLAAAKFRGYWFDDAVKSDSEKILISWYEWSKPSPWDRLLVVGNIGRAEKKVDLKLDLKRLGLAGKKLSFRELWEGKNLDSLDSLSVKPNSFLLIGIKAE